MSELHDLAAAYALDALDPVERADFEAHLATCADCRREVADFTSAAATLASAAATPPPADLKGSVMAAISGVTQDSADAEPPGDEAPPPPPPPTPATADGDRSGADVVQLANRRRTWRWVGGAAAAVVLAVVAIGVVLGTRSSAVTADEVFAAADVEIVTLPGDGSTVRVAWSRELDHVVVDGGSVADPGAGNVYELWAIVGEVAVPAGLIEHGGGSLRSVLDVDDLDDVDVAAWGITIEPAGGSEAPTLPILYYAEV